MKRVLDTEYYEVFLVDEDDIYWHEATGVWLNYVVVNKDTGRAEEFFADFRDSVRCCQTLSGFQKSFEEFKAAEGAGIVIPGAADIELVN